MEKVFHTATDEEILKGATSDIYFLRTKEILKKKGINKRVRAEFVIKNFPNNYEWGILAGIEEAAGLLTRLNVNVRSMPEGTAFKALEPVMEIEGLYNEFGLYETAVLGLLCQASGVATKAARCRKLAGDNLIVSFGARRMHPALSPAIDRSAYIGGLDGVSVVKSAEFLSIPPTGTIPHALIILIGSSKEAISDFDRIIDKKVKRVALVDTFGDEKFEAVSCAEALKGRLYGVRLDTPKSRRGDFRKIIQEVRWELDLRGYKDVKIVVSGGIDEPDIAGLNDVVDGYGIGTSISNAPVLDYAMDIVEVEGRPLAKRGKFSGSKDVLRCSRCLNSHIIPRGTRKLLKCRCGGRAENILTTLIAGGRLLHKLPSPARIREKVISQLGHLDA